MEHFTWEQFDNAVGIIVAKLEDYYDRFDSIYGVPRGGLVLAVALSHRLDLPLLTKCGLRSLVVDDISDSGKTLQPFQDAGKLIATIHLVPESEVHPDVWVHLRKEEWVEYPWEKGG